MQFSEKDEAADKVAGERMERAEKVGVELFAKGDLEMRVEDVSESRGVNAGRRSFERGKEAFGAELPLSRALLCERLEVAGMGMALTTSGSCLTKLKTIWSMASLISLRPTTTRLTSPASSRSINVFVSANDFRVRACFSSSSSYAVERAVRSTC